MKRSGIRGNRSHICPRLRKAPSGLGLLIVWTKQPCRSGMLFMPYISMVGYGTEGLVLQNSMEQFSLPFTDQTYVLLALTYYF